MKYLHKIISNIPIIICIDWLFCALFFTHYDFYNKNFEILDKIDTIIIYFSLMHFFIFTKFYNNSKKKFILTIFVIIILNLFYKSINEIGIYYYLYLALILMPFISFLWIEPLKKI